MKRELVLFGFLFLLVALPVVAAADSEITVKTYPYHKVIVSVLKPQDNYELIEVFNDFSDNSGLASFDFSHDSYTRAHIWVRVKKDSETIFLKKYENQVLGGPLKFVVTPEGWEEPEEDGASENFGNADEGLDDLNETGGNETSQNDTSQDGTLENESDVVVNSSNGTIQPGITGNIISEEGFGFQSGRYYLLGAVVLAGFIGFFLMKKFGSNGRFGKPQKVAVVRSVKSSGHEEVSSKRSLEDLREEIKLLQEKERLMRSKRDFEKSEDEVRSFGRDNKNFGNEGKKFGRDDKNFGNEDKKFY